MSGRSGGGFSGIESIRRREHCPRHDDRLWGSKTQAWPLSWHIATTLIDDRDRFERVQHMGSHALNTFNFG
jgi:hypothetical protein